MAAVSVELGVQRNSLSHFYCTQNNTDIYNQNNTAAKKIELITKRTVNHIQNHRQVVVGITPSENVCRSVFVCVTDLRWI